MATQLNHLEFESFVNSERCKTTLLLKVVLECLRALLIQKDVKPLLFK